MKILKFFLFFFIFFTQTIALQAQSKEEKKFEHRQFNKKSIEEYQNNPDFQYEKVNKPESPNIFQRMWYWFMEQIAKIIYGTTTNSSPVTRWVVIGILAIIMTYALIRLLGADANSLFYRKSMKTAVEMEGFEENIHEIDFDKRIREALQKKQYAQVVRLFYLKSLKKLEDKSLIEWQVGKSNQDYLQELQKKEIQGISENFQRLTFIFEYICYGEFPVKELDFRETEKSFQEFYRQIEKA